MYDAVLLLSFLNSESMRIFMKQLILLLLMLLTFDATASSTKTDSKKDQRELRCLTQNIFFEARGERTTGQLAVAMVTMNRVKSKRFPNSVCGVVWQKRQFSWTHDGKSDNPKNNPSDKKSWKQAKKLAEFIYYKYDTLKVRSNGALDFTRGALHYYAPKMADPIWAKSKEVSRQIGGHIFLVGENS